MSCPVQACNWYGSDLNNDELLQQCLLDGWADLCATRARNGRIPPHDELGLILVSSVYKTLVRWRWWCIDHPSAPAAASPHKVAADVVRDVRPCLPELDVWFAALWATIMNMTGASTMASPRFQLRPVMRGVNQMPL